jgi:hypothetical protein
VNSSFDDLVAEPHRFLAPGKPENISLCSILTATMLSATMNNMVHAQLSLGIDACAGLWALHELRKMSAGPEGGDALERARLIVADIQQRTGRRVKLLKGLFCFAA